VPPRLHTLVPAALAALAATAGIADAFPGAPPFNPGQVYTDNFPDPSVLRVGPVYYAYGTATGGAYLPVLHSTDLRTWTTRSAYAPQSTDPAPDFDDALVAPARWALDQTPGERLGVEVWAPGVARLGGRYVAYYAVRVRARPRRFCISFATSPNPDGPFVDTTSRPLVCDPDTAGSIDPAPFVDPRTGRAWLLWKSEGVPFHRATRIWSRALRPDGTGFTRGSRRQELLKTSLAWEGAVIESPSMVRYGGRLWLLYSANRWNSDRYAIGVARCASPAGPCTKETVPLLASQGTRLGPGGPSGFIGPSGGLFMAYAAWTSPYTSYPDYPACLQAGTCATQGQRRMSVARLGLRSGRLRVTDAG
jgi:beta-xylosidase